ncbi:exosome complex component RRP4 homolog isoform X2 [Coffea eugenioides]|uniref:exosome complex component RRP4 homolog isoform X2 n=1 Tax=Coffea eugenioides TaxID=49369 RepID=UPI000F604FE4|nr:exosome complex component RRP4 homolog isoform X2 [Coffea eugenioides]
MRGVQLSLNKTQKLRLETALEKLESLSSSTSNNSNASVTVADTIPINYEDGVLKGHGTSEMDGRVVATICGLVERVNKLVYVRALRARYKPEIGDIIVGRVMEVAPKHWRLEINFSQDAVLMLSSMNLPDGIQRRRTAVDELNMRSIFEENDIVCLDRGQLLRISPYLVKRRKQHFHHLDQYGVDLILGCNGFIWVGEHVEAKDDMVLDQMIKSEQENASLSGSVSSREQEQSHTSIEIRQHICRIANAVRVLSTLGFMVTVELITELVDLSISHNLDIHEMLGAEFYVVVAEKEAERRSLATKKR